MNEFQALKVVTLAAPKNAAAKQRKKWVRLPLSDSTEPGVIHDVSTRWNLWRERDVPCVNCFPSCFSPMFENVRWRDPEAESLNHDTVTFSE
uniref:YkgJ family cysteine cluster protein n=1 Tax=Bursaphelenchus xylophilus TaxID=6326 RepID=A0A1I7SNW7_BURXY